MHMCELGIGLMVVVAEGGGRMGRGLWGGLLC